MGSTGSPAPTELYADHVDGDVHVYDGDGFPVLPSPSVDVGEHTVPGGEVVDAAPRTPRTGFEISDEALKEIPCRTAARKRKIKKGNKPTYSQDSRPIGRMYMSGPTNEKTSRMEVVGLIGGVRTHIITASETTWGGKKKMKARMEKLFRDITVKKWTKKDIHKHLHLYKGK